MYIIRKHRIQLGIMTIIACLWFSFAFAASEADIVHTLYTEYSSDPGQVHTLIVNYCDAVLTSKSFIKNDFVYDAKYSAFVYLLCSNVVDASRSKLKDTYFKRKSFKELDFTDYDLDDRDLCAPQSMNNECDLATNIPKLFNAIMNDYTNIKQSTIYGPFVEYNSEAQLWSVINDYFQSYFGINICNNTNHSYDKTCRMVKSYVKNTRKILSELTVFDAQSIKDLPACSWSNDNIFVCWLNDAGLTMVSFVNLAYNELFYYRLFMAYYLTMLQKYPGLVSNYSSVYRRFSTQYIRSKSAMSLIFRMIRDMYMAYPLHVGFSMYQEDLDGLGKLIARIVTPIYTLYDKLRNVQEPQ